MPTIFDDALSAFDAAVTETQHYLSFVTSAQRLRGHLSNVLRWEIIHGYQRETVNAFLNEKEYRLEVGFNGLMINLASAFEEYVKELIRRSVRWINGSVKKFEELMPALQNEHFRRSAKLLAVVHEPPAELAVDYEQLCANLGTCRRDGGELLLNAEAFAAFGSALSSDQIEELLERIGLEMNWDSLGQDAKLQAATHQDSTRNAAKEIKRWLKEFGKTRNRIAHTGASVVQTTESEVKDAANILSALADCMANVVEELLFRKYRR
jgi:hypothetical protein